MRLRKFRVRAFRCIHDSGEIKVGDLASFIGRNESGKTTILEALTLLNKDNMPLETENPINATARHFTVELEESVGVSENP